MRLSLRPAREDERAFCEALSRRNVGGYLAARGIPWDSRRYLAGWAELENLVVVAGADVVGVLRLAPEQEALGLRDLQVLPERQAQGVGSWAVRQAQALAADRGYRRVRLRVHEENPARALYARLGFREERVGGGTVHMAWSVPPVPPR